MSEIQYQNYDERDYKALKRLYEKNKATPELVVHYKERPLLIAYLKYMIETMDSKFSLNV